MSVVLGAGNQISVVVLDVLHKMVVEDAVVLVKVGLCSRLNLNLCSRIHHILVYTCICRHIIF